jgi:ATP-dependent Lon protease
MLHYIVLQPPRFDDREAADRVASPGVSVGLVWTTFGGEVQFVEATAMVGKGDLHLTGQLGDVIKESAQLALTWVSIFLFSHLSPLTCAFIYLYTFGSSVGRTCCCHVKLFSNSMVRS